jgi:zinc D-Ala-D-Ala dipeptidase
MIALQELSHRIPIIDPARYGKAYGSVPHDPTDPRSQEPLVLLDTVNVAYDSYHARSDGGNPPYHRPLRGSRRDTWLRAGAATSLARVNERLRPYGYELLVLDGYRSVECQQALYDFYFEQGRASLDMPTDDACHAYANQFVRNTARFSPHNSDAWPAHSTGAAVDITLRSLATREQVDMGSNFEEMSETSHNDYFERQLALGNIAADDPRLWHRRLAHWALESEDWVNSPWVFWHYDLGNQLYVQMRRHLGASAPVAAWYGYIEEPPRIAEIL